MKLESSANQPKMQQRIMLRLAIGLFAIAALLLAWTYAKRLIASGGDIGTVDSAGWILALRQTGSGEQAVILKPDDTVLDSPGYVDGARDEDVVWQPDGNRIYFSSDRDAHNKSLQIYRWNPARNAVDQRSTGKLAQERPIFQEDGSLAGDPQFLMIKAGVVVEFLPNEGAAHQLVPVEGKSPTKSGGEDPSGMGNQFGPEYERLGTSFREAHWCKNRHYIAGIMRSDEGESLVVISMQPHATQSPMDDGAPHGIVKGEHIDMSIDPATGNIAYTVNNYMFINPQEMLANKDTPPEMIQGGKLVKPFRNLIGILDPDDAKNSGPIARWKVGDTPAGKPDVAFAQPQVSPDGSKVAFVIGTDTPNGFSARVLAVATLSKTGGASAKPIVGGVVDSPCWSPDGKQIAFVMLTSDGRSDIEVVGSDGGEPRVLTAGKGNFSSPHFSPMQSKSGP